MTQIGEVGGKRCFRTNRKSHVIVHSDGRAAYDRAWVAKREAETFKPGMLTSSQPPSSPCVGMQIWLMTFWGRQSRRTCEASNKNRIESALLLERLCKPDTVGLECDTMC